MARKKSNALPFELTTDQMVPGLMPGQIARFDGERVPGAGEIIAVALQASQQILIGRYTPGRGKVQAFTLAFDNPAYPPRPIRKADRAEFLGTMVSVATRRSS